MFLFAVVLQGFFLAFLALGSLSSPPASFPPGFFLLGIGSFLPYLYSVYTVRSGKKIDWKFVLGVAILFRLPFYFLPPVLSDDLFRYVWDGRVQWAGINPYLYAPEHSLLADLRDQLIWPFINHPKLTTPYPPVAQMIFFLGGIFNNTTGMKLVLGVFDFAALFALFGLLKRLKKPLGLALIYAWNPLILFEYAWSGHIDTAAVGLLVVSLYALTAPNISPWGRRLGGLAFGASVLVKYLPLLLLPAIWFRGGKEARRGLLWAPLALLTVLPYLGAGTDIIGSLGVYSRRWHANDSVHALVYKGTRFIIDKTVESPVWAPLRIIRQQIDPQKADLAVQAKENQKGIWKYLEASEADKTRFARFQMASYLSRALMLFLLIVAVIWGIRRYKDDAWGASFVAVGGFLAFSPTIHPWYATWGVPFLVRFHGRAMMVFSALVLLSYHVLLTSWKENLSFVLLEYVPVGILLLYMLWERKQKALLTASDGADSL